MRALKNKMSRSFFEKEYDSNVTEEELNALGAGALRRAAREGDVENGSLMCGQIAGMVRAEESCRDIILDVVSGAEKLLAEAAKWVK